MGSKAMLKLPGKAKFDIVLGRGPVAQVAHPTSLKWTAQTATATLIAASAALPGHTRLVLTGGGYIELAYPGAASSDAAGRQPEFLRELHKWALAELSPLVTSIQRSSKLDFVVGVDLFTKGSATGQFALWVGGGDPALVPKRYPVLDEATRLPGVDATQALGYPRVVHTALGPTLLLVCHDAQAYNRRNRGGVRQATHVTARARAIRELDAARSYPGLTWALNLVHWVAGEPNTRTFRISYRQIREDFGAPIQVAGAFGYERISAVSAAGLLELMTAPTLMDLTKVIIRRDV